MHEPDHAPVHHAPVHHDPDGPAPERGDALVMFGLTGDLGEKKLFEALTDLHRAGRLRIPVIAVGRREYSDVDLHAKMRDAVGDASLRVPDDIDLSYVQGDVGETATFERIDQRLGGAEVPVVYAALPPSAFPDLARSIAESPLSDHTRLVVEKPFGDDAESACELYETLTEAIPPERLFIVDHFLAKASVENLSTFRHANPLVDAAMCARLVETVELAMRETGDAADRGSFYEGVGAIDDVVQNHLLQTLALALMEQPADDTDESFHAARAALLAAIDPIDPEHVVVGQYEGYRGHDDVADDSVVETYADVRLAVDSDRWRGVPMRIVTGKALDQDLTLLTITLRPADGQPPNQLRFRLKPSSSVEFVVGVLDPDDRSHGLREAVTCIAVPDDHAALGDYATMLDNALSGSQRHFAQLADVVEGWRIVTPAHIGAEPEPYAPGSAGPEATTPGPWAT